MTLTRPCIVDGCTALTRTGSRCPAHQAALRTKYRGPWPAISRAAITDYRARHGDTCPGWATDPHTINPDDWTTDHTAGPLCRACNARKRSLGDG